MTAARADGLMTAARSAVVSLPARDESAVIHDCLASIRASVRHARRLRLLDRAVVVVAAHRCSDDTAALAERALRRSGGPVGVVIDDDSTTIGQVRDRAARRGLARLGGGPDADATWIMSTDADTVVGEDWIARVLGVADLCEAVCVVGLAALDEWRGSAGGLRAYDEILRAKFRGDTVGDEHDHVYGANLAIRADAYVGVGGFPHTPHGEDQQLVDALALAGYRVARTRAVSVTTSGRTEGRAEGGLADLLWRLDRDPLRYDAERHSALTGGAAPPGTRKFHSTCQPDSADPWPDSHGLEDAVTVRR